SVCVVMNRPSLDKFEELLKPNGTLVMNTTLIDNQPTRKDISILKIPLTQMATKLGNVRCANMIALGALNAKLKLVSLKALIESLKEVIPPYRHSLLPINEEALKEGTKLVSRNG
ncbi:MAG: hypothetical protein AMJ78_10345, partial [Omnitrophica WOR_2 bacterium SM23_29]